MNFQPVLDRILLRKIEAVQEKNGIAIPETYQESNKYEVVALGDFVMFGGERVPLSDLLSIGDVVLVSQYNVERIEIEDGEFWLSRIQDVRGKQRVGNRTGVTAAVPARVSSARH